MINNKTIAVVVPAYNEESQIGMVIETMPEFVDRIVIVNDCSTDTTADKVKEYIIRSPVEEVVVIKDQLKKKPTPTIYNPAEIIVYEQNLAERKRFTPAEIFNSRQEQDRIILINHTRNGGVGASIATGYKWCKDHGIDCTAVMAGDGQMDPAELESICRPVVEEGIDYVKGNRLIHRSSWLVIPRVRYFGNSILSILTKIASGYWHVSDTQTGYTAISQSALNAICLYDIYRSYGMPNDMLVKLNIAFCTLREVEIKPVYNVGENSKMKILKVVPRVSWLLIKSFFKRLWIKYLFRDFHPLFILYNLSFLLGILALMYGGKIAYLKLWNIREVDDATILAFMFLFTSAFQSLLFAMWMDIQDNERLNK
ncbi:MAG: glycosyltransferase family 2 protein [Candidatus Brocadia sp. WS118]|nr:MAG: glycosyltransferase family 2 protein [Candidatus Brocadia sp. WS118]